MPQIIIRDAKITDAGRIAELAIELAEYEDSHGSSSEQSIMSAAFSANPACYFMLAENNKANESPNIVGFAMYYDGYDLTSSSRGFHLGDIYVEESFRGGGIGTKFIEKVAEKLSNEVGEWISWTVSKENPSAIKFYESFDAHKINVQFMALGKKEINEICKNS
jgi:ribosomal protein S18 acetylase RimI-like enzyme